MSKNKERYIVYLNMQYFEKVCKVNGAQTLGEIEKLRLAIDDQIQSFLTGRNKTMLCADIFTGDNGELQKSVEIYRLSDMARINNLADLERLMDKQRKRGYVELKKSDETHVCLLHCKSPIASCHSERSEESDYIHFMYTDSSLRSDELLRTLSEK